MSKETPCLDPIWTSKTTTYAAPAASKWEVQVRYFSDRDPYIEVKERSNVGNLGEVVNYELYKVDVEAVCEQNARILGMSIISLQKKFNDLNKVGVNGRISD